MKTPRWGPVMAFGAIAWIPLAAACSKDSNLVVAPPPPTPTPAPSANINGAWTGAFHQARLLRCDTTAEASASFQQQGSSLSGTFTATAACGFRNVPFQGVIMGDTFTGTAKGGILEWDFDSARGTLNGPDQMLVGFFGSSGRLVCTLNLHR